MSKIYLLTLSAIIFIGVGYFISKNDIYFAPKLAVAETVDNTSEPTTPEKEKEETKSDTSINMDMVKKIHIIGDENAPIKIDKIVSLSCSHCATYHKMVHPQIKKNFIDTGKAYMVYHDFPTNAPSLYASSLARCLPEKQFFRYIDLLFKTQHSWVHDHENYEKKLKQSATLAGISKDMAEKCINNEKIHEHLINNIKEMQKKYEIKSTPTFIINNGEEIISGVRPYSEMEVILNKYLPE